MKAAKTIAISMLLVNNQSASAQQSLNELQVENDGQVDELDFLINDKINDDDATVPVPNQQAPIFNLDEDNMIIDEQNSPELNAADEHFMPDQLDDEFEEAYQKELADKQNIFETKEDAPPPDPIKRYEHIGDNSTNDDISGEDLDNKFDGMSRSKKRMERYSHILISDARRPVYGVLTEPMKGDLVKSIELDDRKHTRVETERLRQSEKKSSYVPRAHVQFLEQAGVRVVPISYLDDTEEIRQQLDEVNGIYMPGDSHLSVADDEYQIAFMTVYDYVKEHNENQDYFPMFLMGKSGQTFIKQASYMKNTLQHMRHWTNGNVRVNLLKEHEDTFLFHALQNDTSADHAIRIGHYFNKQGSGIRVKDLMNDENLKLIISPLATIEGSAYTPTKLSFYDYEEFPYNPEEEFVAIAEGFKLPIYMFTYNVEMTQFMVTDLEREPDQTELIDKSIAARHHAQFIAHQIADEGRLNNHNVVQDGDPADATRCMQKIWKKLIRHHKLVTLDLPDETENTNIEYPLPKGLHSIDVYIIEQKVKQIEQESDLLLKEM